MDGGKTRGRIYRQMIIEVLADYWEFVIVYLGSEEC